MKIAVLCRWIWLPVFLLLTMSACSRKNPEVDPPTIGSGSTGLKIESILNEAEQQFRKMHLSAWYQAEQEYEKADRMDSSSAIRERLLLTRFLILMRELDENILGSHHLHRLTFICESPEAQHQDLCTVAKTSLRLKRLLTEPAPEFSSEEYQRLTEKRVDSELERYLYILMIRDLDPPRYFEAVDRFLLDFPESMLSVYLKMQNLIPIDGLVPLVELGEFAEFLFRHGASLINEEDFSRGIGLLKKSIELVPRYTSARKELGSAYLYDLEHYPYALDQYEAAVETDSKDVEALLGKSIALHYLGEYLVSNLVLERMFDTEQARWQVLNRKQQVYFKGQGYYFRAYNLYLLGYYADSRFWVDQALRFQPELDGPHYLSGLLFIEEAEFKEAEREFLQVIEDGTTLCDAYFRLGKIEYQRDSSKVFPYFEANSTCLDDTIQVFDNKIDRLDRLLIDNVTRQGIRSDLQKRKRDFVDQAIASSFNMIMIAEKIKDAQSRHFIQSIEGFWKRISNSQ